MKKIFMLTIVCILLCSHLSAADITVNGGLLHTQNSNYGDGVSTNIRVEKPILNQVNAGLEAGYHGPTSHYSEDKDGFQYGKLSGYSLLGELLWYPEVNWRVKPYILGGWGYSWWDFDRSQDVKDLGISVDMGNAFAQKYGLGADYLINEHWSFNMEWYWFRASVPKDARHSDGSNSIILTDEKTIGQEETCIVLGLKYSW